MVSEGLASSAIVVLIDEGGRFLKRRKQREGLSWQKWDCGGANPREVHVLTGVFG